MANAILRASVRFSVWGLKKVGRFVLFESPNIILATVILYVGWSLYERHMEAVRFHKAERHCLALNVYWESHNESVLAQIYVALTTRERVRNRRYGSTYCEVVYQAKQFSWTNGSAVSRTPALKVHWKRAKRIASDVYAGNHDFPKSWGCRPMFYKRADDRWTSKRGRGFFYSRIRAGKMKQVGQEGAHAFYCLTSRMRQKAQITVRPLLRRGRR